MKVHELDSHLIDSIDVKVGDYLVAKREFGSDELFKVDRIGVAGGIYDEKWRLLFIWKMEHATLKEIKAGRRLS